MSAGSMRLRHASFGSTQRSCRHSCSAVVDGRSVNVSFTERSAFRSTVVGVDGELAMWVHVDVGVDHVVDGSRGKERSSD